jgi:hypothetical protein
VLVGDNLPELGTDLVAALASLDVDDLAHACELLVCCGVARAFPVQKPVQISWWFCDLI